MRDDYLDEDVAYLVGMIVGRGTIVERERRWITTIEIRFVNPQLEGYDRFSDFVTSIVDRTLPRIRNLIGEVADLSLMRPNRVQIVIDLPASHMVVRNLKKILEGRTDHRQFRVPAPIRGADQEIVKEFVRGFADVAGNIRRSNRDRSGYHRVYLDVLNENWALPVELCELLQNRLQTPVHEILWGHPNLRDPQARKPSQSPFREHQVRIYAHDFLKVGFYIDHKQRVLEALADENLQKGRQCQSSFCIGMRWFRPKSPHPAENDERLPSSLRGKHFDAYWQICASCGCPLAQEAMKQLRQQGRFPFRRR